MSAVEGRLAVPGGTVWYGVVGGGRRPPLLVVHGGLGSVSHDYLDPLGALATGGRRVVFWDQLGCGRSDAPDDPGVYRIERYVEEVADFDRRHACRIDPPPEPLRRALALAGHSPQYRVMNGPNEFVLTGNLGTWDRRDRLAEVDLPALVSCGRFDKFAPECSEELQRGLPRATLQVFEHSSHMSHLEEPERFLATTAHFLHSVEGVA